MKHLFANFKTATIQRPVLNTSDSVQKLCQERIKQLGNTLDNIAPHAQDEQDKYLQLKYEWLARNNAEPLLPARFNEYDLVLAIGGTCQVSQILNYFDLRRFSNPFEWTAGKEPKFWFSQPDVYRDTRFHEKISALRNNFKDWLDPQYFKYTTCAVFPNTEHHQIVNIKTNIRYMHEFPADRDIAQHMPDFVTKMQRRIKNLYTAIADSQKILIVWLSNIWDQKTMLEQTVSDKDIKWAIKQMHKMYPSKQFDFVFFEHDGRQNKFEFEKIMVAPGAFHIKSNHFLTDSAYNYVHPVDNADRPHVHVISEMLDNIHLSDRAFALPENYHQDER